MAAGPASSRPSGRATSVAERIPRSTPKRGLLVLGALGLVVVLLFAWLVVRAQDDPVRQTATVAGDLPWSVAGWRGEQLESAAIVMRAGRDLGLSERDVRLGVMTAMGESSLRVLDRGDRAGPDSRGLFQQRDGWGPYEVRMDAYGSAVLFFRALAEVEARDAIPPTLVAHAVQINRDPEHYARWWEDAGAVVAAIDATDATVVVERAG